MEELLGVKIKEKVDEYGYKSAKFRLVLIKELSFWKILMAKIILNITEPENDTIHLKEEDFVIVDVNVSIERFKEFVDYLNSVYIGNISKEGKATIQPEFQFKIGEYDLCFIGNYPGRDFQFHGSNVGSMHYGIDKPCYLIDYAIHQSISAQRHPKLDLTGAKIPLRNASEAINYFWGTHFEEHSLSSYCVIYMPIYEAKILDFKINKKTLEFSFEINKNRTNLNELSLGLIAEDKTNNFRDRFPIKNSKLEINLEFIPNQVNAYLNLKGKKIDEYNYYNYEPIKVARPARRQNRRDLIYEYETDEKHLLDYELVSKLPEHIQFLLTEAEDAYKEELFRATAILFRSAIEEGITLIIKQIEKEDEIYDDKFEVGLGKKINLITKYMTTFKQVKRELEDVKWFGDKATHEAQMKINSNDISNNLEPKLRLILTKMVEELSYKR